MVGSRVTVAAGAAVVCLSVAAFAGWRVLVLQQTAQDAREHLTVARTALSEAAINPSEVAGSGAVGGWQLVSACTEATAASGALQDVHAQLDLVMPLVNALESVPGVGAEARTQTATLEAGTQVAAAGASLCDGLAPLATLLSGNSGAADAEAAGDILHTLVGARPKLVGATERLKQLEESLAGVPVQDLDDSNRTALLALRQRLPQAITTLREGTVLLDLLGAQQTRRYLLVSQNPDELRATGGFIGSAGVVEASGGSIRLVEYGSSRRYDTPLDRRAVPPAEFQTYLGPNSWNLAAANWWVSFPDVARQLEYFYSLSRPQKPVDGVIALDQFGLEQLLQVLGAVQVPEYGETVQASEVESKLDRYVHSGSPSDESGRKQFTAALSQAVLQAVLEAPPGKLPALVQALRASLDQQHLLVWVPDPEAASFLARKHWDGGLLTAARDSLLLVDTDVVGSKQSQAVTRDASYALNLAEPTSPTASLKITYTNTSRPDQRPGISFVPEYRTFLRAVVPPGAQLLSTSGFAGPVSADQECGRRVFGGEVLIPQAASVQVSLRYQLPPSVGAGGYDLVVQQQPGVPPGSLAVAVQTVDGSTARADLPNSPGAHVDWRMGLAESASLSAAPLPAEVPGCGQALVEAQPVAPPESIQVTGAHIDASIVELGVSEDGQMEAPPTPDVVGWYRMSARPGEPGNSVMAGHVDWGQNTAVFWNLQQLQQGDKIHVRGTDGNLHTYAVEWNQVFAWQTAPVDELVGPTEDSVLTLITCDGVFDTHAHEYLDRRVVRARLVD